MIQSPPSAASFKNGTALLLFPFSACINRGLSCSRCSPAPASYLFFFFCAVLLGALPLPGPSCDFSLAATANVGFSAVAGGLTESKLWFIKYPEYLC